MTYLYAYRGCKRATVTFFRYDNQQNKLITIHVLRNPEALITCLHVSQDKFSRFLAVAFYTHRECVLKVWRMEDPPEYPRYGWNKPGLDVIVTESLADRYRSKRCDGPKWIIKVRTRTYMNMKFYMENNFFYS